MKLKLKKPALPHIDLRPFIESVKCKLNRHKWQSRQLIWVQGQIGGPVGYVLESCRCGKWQAHK